MRPASTRRVAGQVAHRDGEAVSLQRAARQLALVSGGFEHFEPLSLQPDEFLRGALAARHGEGLRGDRVAVLEARESHLEGLATHRARQLTRHPFGVCAALANESTARAVPRRWQRTPGFRRLRSLPASRAALPCADGPPQANGRRERCAAPVIRDHQAFLAGSNNTTACAASPSLRPMKPRCSVVVALMFTWFSVTPSICASERRISSR